ncbi:Alginate lyase 2 [Candidatus Roizmanbacteria bacterium]|nr:Alginate lyase 2 [Candidatus Roizmanbacteria bacterium]
MDVFTLLSYINKVSLIAFFITTAVVGYQIYILKKEKSKEKAPSIPDFQENNNLNMVANFTNLPNSLTKKELKAVNYSKTVLISISVLTVIVIVFVISLIGRNSSSNDQALVSPTPVISRTPTAPAIRRTVFPTPVDNLTPTMVATLSALLITPTVEASPSPMLKEAVEATPTEIILAKATTLTPTVSISVTQKPLTVLPETGSVEKGLLIIGVAISTIFFSFWF